MNKLVHKKLHTTILLLVVIVSAGTAPALAQWETIFDKATNANGSPAEYYIEGDILLLGRGGGGLYFSEDGGATWNEEVVKPLGSDSKLGKFFKFKGEYYLHRKDYQPDNFVKSSGDFTEWTVVEGLPKNADETTRGLSQIANNDDIIFFESWEHLDGDMNTVTDHLFSEDGSTWTHLDVTNKYSHYQFLGDDMYAFAGPAYMKSSDKGVTWDEIGALPESMQMINIYHRHIAGAATLYAATAAREGNMKYVMAWDMDANEWNSVFEIAADFGFNIHVDGDRIGVTVLNQGSFYSPDGGATWSSLGTEEVNPQSVYLDGDYFYVTTKGKLFGADLKRISVSEFQEATSVENTLEIPTRMELGANYPNPFNPSTSISFKINEEGHTQLRIFDITGREVATLVDEFKQAGSYNVSADLASFSSGVYIYQLSLNGQTLTRKMSLIK